MVYGAVLAEGLLGRDNGQLLMDDLEFTEDEKRIIEESNKRVQFMDFERALQKAAEEEKESWTVVK